MSTCIVAISGSAGLFGQPDIIVTASDTRLSFSGEYSAEGSVKIHTFHKEWGVMFAGKDISQAVPVIDRAKDLLRGKSGALSTVTSAFKKAYRDQLREVIEDELLSRYNMTMEDFKKKGKTQLLPEVFTEFSLTIKIATLGCSFLVWGLDDKKIGHIFTVRNPGRAEVHDKPGFWAIGNGAPAALSMLAALKQVRGKTAFAETVYNILAAKFMSESASDVGRETVLYVKKYGTQSVSHKSNMLEVVRSFWDKEGSPRTSNKAVEAIRSADWRFRQRSSKKKSNSNETQEGGGSSAIFKTGIQ